jgi:nucleotide-binding universal stress UspA family protein
MTGMARGCIAVGVDGSAGSRHALDWGLAEAHLRGCALEVVTVVPEQDDPVTLAMDRVEATRMLRALVEDARADRHGSSAIRSRVLVGPPVEELSLISENVDLVVLGSHGVTGLIHSALGSTSDAVARMSDCPVVIVPVRERATGTSLTASGSTGTRR